MALIPCYECSREISDKAFTCPHCGAPKEEQPSQAEEVEVVESVALENEPAPTPPKEPESVVSKPDSKEPLSAGLKVALSFGVVLFWVAVVRTWWTGAPDRSMGLLDMIPVIFIWWLWSAKGPRVSARTSSPKPHAPTTTRKSPPRHPLTGAPIISSKDGDLDHQAEAKKVDSTVEKSPPRHPLTGAPIISSKDGG